STIVQYDGTGDVQNTYTIAGEADRLKFDPRTGDVWALQNQDANSTVILINPATQQVSDPLKYDSGYVYGTDSARGYDDVAFNGGNVFLSYTNPVNPGDPVIERLLNGTAPFGTLETSSVLSLGDTGTNLATGETNQPLPLNDPDSLKTLPDGSLILTSERDVSFTIVQHPGTAQQTASFISLPSGSPEPDGAIVPTSTSGTFLVSNTTGNDITEAKVTGLNTNDIYASVGTAIDQIDPHTGNVTPVVTGLSGAHGLLFVPSSSPTTIGDLLKDLAGDLKQVPAALASNASTSSMWAGAAGAMPGSGAGYSSVMSPDQVTAALAGTTHTGQA
ncbi:MAG: hypothetical protein M3Y41_02895, partial [Pseudomonadota bacterium]|nr:hypothetical protein [Pseudomonadota bacterium]